MANSLCSLQKCNLDQFQIKHEAKKKGDAVLDFGIRSLDSIPDKESDNDGSSDSSDKSAENSPERGGADAVPRKLQFSPSERDDDDDDVERRKGKGAMAVSSGEEEEEEVEDDDSYDSSFIDDEDDEQSASESESESSSASAEFLHDYDDDENASPSNWRSTSPKLTPKTKRKGRADGGRGRTRTPLSQLNNGQRPPPVLLTFLQSLSLVQPTERCFQSIMRFFGRYLFSA